MPDIGVKLQGHVAIIEIRRPPHNFFDVPLISGLADTLELLDQDPQCRVTVLCAEGTAFCAGANFSDASSTPKSASARTVNPIYNEALRIFSCSKPMVAAIHGPAIGGGLGLALVADFRVACPEARFAANFNRLGFHPGFGLSVTLPRLIGAQNASLLFYTGRRIGGEKAHGLGLVDVLTDRDHVRETALALAQEIAESAPMAVMSTRATLRSGLVDSIRLAVARESEEQSAHFQTQDFKEGVAAMSERRKPAFRGC
jgi:enoyl-CoA hydratase/carnithine racemase